MWPTLQTFLRGSDEILEIGCGNSPLAEYLWKQGLRRFQCIDFSAFCVEQMQKRAHEQQMAIMYRTMDVRALDYPAAQFHVVLDKVLSGRETIAHR